MAKRQIEGCAHCWHVGSSCTDGLSRSGWDDETCCFCGGERRRFWRWRRDPLHGSHVEINERIYMPPRSPKDPGARP